MKVGTLSINAERVRVSRPSSYNEDWSRGNRAYYSSKWDLTYKPVSSKMTVKRNLVVAGTPRARKEGH